MLVSRHDLPSGGWVELRDGAMLRAKDQKKIMRAMRGTVLTPEAMAAAKAGEQAPLQAELVMSVGLSASDGVIALIVTDWKIPYAPEPTADGAEREWVLPSADPLIVDELSLADYNELCRLVQPLLDEAFPGAPDPTDHADPTSPTGPANGSDNGSRATP